MTNINPLIERCRKIVAGGIIHPEQIYSVDVGNGEIYQWKGSELIADAQAQVDFFDAQERGDRTAMARALKRMGMLPEIPEDVI
jgi:hypothetical protein